MTGHYNIYILSYHIKTE